MHSYSGRIISSVTGIIGVNFGRVYTSSGIIGKVVASYAEVARSIPG